MKYDTAQLSDLGKPLQDVRWGVQRPRFSAGFGVVFWQLAERSDPIRTLGGRLARHYRGDDMSDEPKATQSCVALIAVLGFALAGCQTETGACPTPPPNQAEQRPLPPVADYEQTWQPGHWDWIGSGYTWQPGAWVQRGPNSLEWMNGYWARTASPGPCVWVTAHWLAGL